MVVEKDVTVHSWDVWTAVDAGMDLQIWVDRSGDEARNFNSHPVLNSKLHRTFASPISLSINEMS